MSDSICAVEPLLSDMDRRTFLTGAGLATAALAGCLDGAGGRGPRDISVDERCSGYVLVSSLPEPADEEATTAIENGVYETDREPMLPELIDVDATRLVVDDARKDDGRYYDISTESADSVTRLHAEETLPETNEVNVRNRTETELTIDIHLEYEDDPLLEETLTLESGRIVSLDDAEYRYGTYHVELTAPDVDLAVTDTWTVDESRTQALINVDRNDIFIGQTVSESPYCDPAVE